MTIRTITCHNAYNAGAKLQTYALAAYLKKYCDDVEIINYMPDYLRSYKLFGVDNVKYDRPFLRTAYQAYKFPGRVKGALSRRKAIYDAFSSEYLSVTKQRYDTFEELAKSPPDADIIFAGSDQIWNTLFQNGKDPAFYLEFAKKNSIRASYAASFATDDISPGWHDTVKKRLEKLDYISVRESSGLKILQHLGINNAERSVDPVFLFGKEFWESFGPKIDIPQPYLLLYDCDKNEAVINFARELADNKKWKFYSVFKCPLSDKSFESEGPLEFLSLIREAEFIISNSFHATAFSIIFEKKFLVFDRYEKLNSRMRDLLTLTGLEDRLLTEELNPGNGDIDFMRIRPRLEAEIQKSKGYIEKVIRKAAENER